jgi:hypothetical protein
MWLERGKDSMAKLCAKCGRYDPAKQLTLSSRCPSCGVMYAHVGEQSASAASKLPPSSSRASMTSSASDESDSTWLPLDRPNVFLSTAIFGVLLAIILLDDDGFITQMLGWLGMIGCALWLWRLFKIQHADR